MSSMAIFEKVAAGELTPQQAAQLMLDADRRATSVDRPVWLHPALWTLVVVCAGALLASVGIRRES